MAHRQSDPDEPSSPSSRRTISGIVVHVLGMLFGIVGAGLVYLLANATFTQNNARNALNWQLLVLIAGVVAAVLAFGLGLVFDVFVIVGGLIVFISFLLNFVFSLWATIKAIGGSEWKYPLAPEIIS